MTRRWRWPPENSCGKRIIWSRRRPTFSNSVATWASISDFEPRAKFVQRLGDDVLGAHARIERRVGVLEDDLQVLAVGTHVGAGELVDARTVEMDFAGRRLDQLEDQLAGGRLAAAGFAHQAQRFAGPDGERYAVDGIRPWPSSRLKMPWRTGKCFLRPFTSSTGVALMHAAPTRRSASQQATQWPRGFLLQRRIRLPAPRGGVRAARREDAAGNGFLERWHDAGNLGQPVLVGAGERGAEARHRAEQRLRVGMARPARTGRRPAPLRPCGRRT